MTGRHLDQRRKGILARVGVLSSKTFTEPPSLLLQQGNKPAPSLFLPGIPEMALRKAPQSSTLYWKAYNPSICSQLKGHEVIYRKRNFSRLCYYIGVFRVPSISELSVLKLGAEILE